MKKINIAEVLKDCPKGMELDCAMYEDVYFDYVDELNIIHCYIQYGTHKTSLTFNQHGTPNGDIKSKCVIFPIGKTTWEGFTRPFEDGDIVTCTNENCTYTAIYKEMKDNNSFYRHAVTYDNEFYCVSNDWSDFNETCRFATEEEKEKLFDAIKANGYKWNAETKTLEELIEPKFKVGDKVLWNYDTKIIRTISKVQLSKSRGYVYWIDCEGCSSGWWNENELTPIPNKFDITTLKPFESRVLVRNDKSAIWKPAIYGIYKDSLYWMVGGSAWIQCIPYKENKHLLGTTNNCDEFYKTW